MPGSGFDVSMRREKGNVRCYICCPALRASGGMNEQLHVTCECAVGTIQDHLGQVAILDQPVLLMSLYFSSQGGAGDSFQGSQSFCIGSFLSSVPE